MNVLNVILEIVYLPENFKRLSNISTHNLLKKSGYFEVYDQIRVKDIMSVLNEAPELIDVWMSWSEDNRRLRMHFFKDYDNKYIVDYYPIQKDSKKAHTQLQSRHVLNL